MIPEKLNIELFSGTSFASSDGQSVLLDTELLHDPDTGLPFISGKGIHGLLRDAWLSMREHFPELESAAMRILGDENKQESGVVHISNAFPPVVNSVSEAIKKGRLQTAQVLNSLTEVRVQTAIDRQTASAKENSLRSSRVLLREVPLIAKLTWFETPNEFDLKVFRMCTSAIRNIGLKRNRGRGAVRFYFDHDTQTNKESAQNNVGSEGNNDDLGASKEERNNQPSNSQLDSEQGFLKLLDQLSKLFTTNREVKFKYIPYKLTLETPLLAKSLEGDPNSAQSLDYIPGSLIRGAVAQRLIKFGIKPDGETYDNLFKQIILKGKYCFLNAYPISEASNERSLPKPCTLMISKQSRSRGYNLAAWTGMNDWPDNSLMPEPYSFVREDGAAMNSDKHFQFHHSRDRTRGMSTSNAGAVFSYSALTAHQTFAGLIRVQTNEDDFTHNIFLRKIFEQPISLGRSRRAEYGGISRIDIEHNPINDEIERFDNLTSQNSGECFVAQLTSDFIGRCPITGQVDPSTFGDLVSKSLNQKASIESCFFNYGKVGGYNRKWGTEIPQDFTLKAGSVVVLKARERIEVSELMALEHSGIGERLSEGFGRFVFLPMPSKEDSTLEEVKVGKTNQHVKDSKATIELMQKRLLLQVFEQSIESKVVNWMKNVGVLPSASLVGQLQEALRKGTNEVSYLLNNKLKKKAKEKLKKCKVNSQPLPELLNSLVNSEWFTTAPTIKIIDLSNIYDQWAILVDEEGIVDKKGIEKMVQDDFKNYLQRKIIASLLNTLHKKAKAEKLKGASSHG